MNQWDDESCDWHGLETDGERPRYAAIAEQIDGRKAKTVLDVGCGTAVLSSFLSVDIIYKGVEPSSKAVAEAKTRNVSVVHATAEEFSPDHIWDSMVFNEVLYYAMDPIGLLRKYSRALRPSGTIIISIFQKGGSPSLKRRITHWMDPRRPMSNLQCAEMVLEFIHHEGWTVLVDRQVPSLQGDTCWRLLVVEPRVSAA